MSNFSGVLREFQSHIYGEWRTAEDHDAYEFRASAYDADREGIPRSSDLTTHSIGAVSGRLVVAARTTGAGPLLSAVREVVRETVERTFEEHTLLRLAARLTPIRNLDAVLFAIDHDNGHDLAVETAIRELWQLSGEDTWKAYAVKRDQLLRWLAAFADDPPTLGSSYAASGGSLSFVRS